MYNINAVMIEGEVAGDPVVIAQKDGKPSITVVAIKHIKKHTRGEIVSYFDLKAYGSHAEMLLKLVKEQTVIAYGSLKQERYKSTKTGQWVKAVIIEPFKIVTVDSGIGDTVDVVDKSEGASEPEEDLGF